MFPDSLVSYIAASLDDRGFAVVRTKIDAVQLVRAGAGLFGYLVFGVFQSRDSTIPIRRVLMATGIATLVMAICGLAKMGRLPR